MVKSRWTLAVCGEGLIIDDSLQVKAQSQQDLTQHEVCQ